MFGCGTTAQEIQKWYYTRRVMKAKLFGKITLLVMNTFILAFVGNAHAKYGIDTVYSTNLTDVESKENIRQAVAAAVGANLNQGYDEVVVEGIKFRKGNGPIPPGKNSWMPLIQVVIAAFMVVFVLGFVRAVLKPKATFVASLPKVKVVYGGELDVSVVSPVTPPPEINDADGGVKPDGEEEEDDQEGENEGQRRKEIHDKIIECAREKPGMVANILATWLAGKEEEGR